MTISQFISKLKEEPRQITFNDTMSVIDNHYNFTPCTFKNADVINQSGENSGSCKLFYFAHLQQLCKEETLSCFGQYYTDVLNTPEGNDHQNIRNFMKTGWDKISFDQIPLTKKI
ncbi:HopJ type III effector protein [Aquimarina sp. MMG016]|uniref:HopJ type III effector protein n=1 Tax=Aquimarina sp. MMG016 TaxID=2822690 RepID=UPI001B39F859|nr:HopJ type III effector protein [Aquimarina sp. MMG016]MBQ4819892.1 HopJ type III effector protein [Aquimarina sp. MMG016]